MDNEKPFSNISPWKTLKTSKPLACNQVSMVYDVLLWQITSVLDDSVFNFRMLAMFICVIFITRCLDYLFFFFCFYHKHRSVLEAVARRHLDWLGEEQPVMLIEYLLQKAGYWQYISWQYSLQLLWSKQLNGCPSLCGLGYMHRISLTRRNHDGLNERLVVIK